MHGKEKTTERKDINHLTPKVQATISKTNIT